MSFPTGPNDPNPYATTSTPPLPGGYPPGNPNQVPMALAIASLVAGLMGGSSCLCCFTVPLPLLAVILGAVALANKPDQNAKVIAIVGIVLGGIGLLGTVAMYAFAFVNAAVSR